VNAAATYNGDMTKKITLTTKKTTISSNDETVKTASAPRTHASGARATAAKRRTRGDGKSKPAAVKTEAAETSSAKFAPKSSPPRTNIATRAADARQSTDKTRHDGTTSKAPRAFGARGEVTRSTDARGTNTRRTESTKDTTRRTTARATEASGAETKTVHTRPPNARSGRPLVIPTAPPKPTVERDDGTIRLSKLMSLQGIASRREADEWIAKGWVKVDDVVINELGTRILPTQIITVSTAAKKEQESRVTILLNKPVGYVSGQAEDGHQPASVLFIGENRWENDDAPVEFHPMQAKGLAPAGRLDIDSVGLIVFTQDGRVAKQLIGDNSEVEKEYLVRVTGTLSVADLKLLNHGLSLEGKALRPAEVSWQNEDQLRFVLHEGKKRQIRHMCEMVGLTVVGLKRIRIGKIMLGNLPPGKWRYLAANESFD
jgi:23S rRNA pseudouridine2604 synthase